MPGLLPARLGRRRKALGVSALSEKNAGFPARKRPYFLVGRFAGMRNGRNDSQITLHAAAINTIQFDGLSTAKSLSGYYRVWEPKLDTAIDTH